MTFTSRRSDRGAGRRASIWTLQMNSETKASPDQMPTPGGILPPRLAAFLSLPFFDDRHRELAAKLHGWCSREFVLHDDDTDIDLDDRCRDLVRRLAEGGWLRYCVPESHGGVNPRTDIRSLCLIRQILGYHSGLADFAFAMQGLGSGTIILYGTEAQKAAYLPAVAAGEKIAAFAMTEVGTGSDVANMETRATLNGDHYLITGEKTFISNGGIADFYLLLARTGEAPGARGISTFVVDAGSEGFSVAERIEVIAPHPLARLRLENCRVSATALVGTAGAGFAQSMATLDLFRPTVGAAALGFAERALADATQRAIGRKLFGKPLSDNAVTQSKLAEMVVDADAAALLIYRAAWIHDVAGAFNSREAAVAKLYATEAAQAVIDKAVQIHGGLGVVKGVVVESLYREIRALRIYEGASEVQKIVIARRHLAASGLLSPDSGR